MHPRSHTDLEGGRSGEGGWKLSRFAPVCRHGLVNQCIHNKFLYPTKREIYLAMNQVE